MGINKHNDEIIFVLCKNSYIFFPHNHKVLKARAPGANGKEHKWMVRDFKSRTPLKWGSGTR